MEMYVLLENNSIDARYKPKHGLSILIKHNGKNILLELGKSIPPICPHLRPLSTGGKGDPLATGWKQNKMRSAR